MSNLPISSKYRSTPSLPVPDGEREGLVARLNAAYERGEVTGDDYRALLDTAFGARTLGELVPVVEALPPSATYAEPSAVAQTGRPGELSEARGPWTPLVVAALSAGVLALVVIVVVVLGLNF